MSVIKINAYTKSEVLRFTFLNFGMCLRSLLICDYYSCHPFSCLNLLQILKCKRTLICKRKHKDANL